MTNFRNFKATERVKNSFSDMKKWKYLETNHVFNILKCLRLKQFLVNKLLKALHHAVIPACIKSSVIDSYSYF